MTVKLSEIVSRLDSVIKGAKREQTEDHVLYILRSGIVIEVNDLGDYVRVRYGCLDLVVDDIVSFPRQRKIMFFAKGWESFAQLCLDEEGE